MAMADGTKQLDLATFLGERDDLIALAKSVVGHHDVAEDVVQDSWIRWHQSDYPADRAKPILRRMVANLARDWWRWNKRTGAIFGTYEIMAQRSSPDTERVVVARQEIQIVVEALKKLPERTFLAFKWYRLDGLTYRQIAERLDVCPARAYQLVTQALARIAMQLDR